MEIIMGWYCGRLIGIVLDWVGYNIIIFMFNSVKFTNLNHHHQDFNEKLSEELSKLTITERS